MKDGILVLTKEESQELLENGCLTKMVNGFKLEIESMGDSEGNDWYDMFIIHPFRTIKFANKETAPIHQFEEDAFDYEV